MKLGVIGAGNMGRAKTFRDCVRSDHKKYDISWCSRTEPTASREARCYVNGATTRTSR